ncbi:MAG: hypothetical protein KDE27_17970 [Planctomycetes bacterium]|nr:hypothetical protein [Planctomycetota bacterium]
MNHPKCLALATIALFGAPLLAQDSLLPYLPRNTLIAVSAPDLTKTIAEFGNTPVAKMWKEEEVQTFFGDVIEFAKERIDEGMAEAKQMHENGELPVDPEQLTKLRVGGVTAALTKLDVTTGGRRPMPQIGVALHIDFGDSGETWNQLLRMGLGMLEAQAGGQMEKTESKIGGVDLISMMPTGANAPEMGLNVAFVPNGVLICTLPDEARSILTKWTAKEADLGATEMYAALSKRVDADGAEVQSFIRFDPMIRFGLKALGIAAEREPKLAEVDLDGVERALVAMGLRNLGVYAEAGKYVDGKTVTKGVHLRSDGAVTAAAPTGLDMSFLKWVPKDAVSFSAWTWDVASFYDTLVKGLQAYDPEFARMALDKLGKVEEQLGFKIRDDLFGAFGDHAINWSMAVSTIASMPETALLLKVNDEQKLVTVLRNLSQLSNGMVEFEEGERRGIQVYSLRVNFDPTDGMGMNPFDMLTPTFSFKSGYMVAGFSVGDIKRVFKRMEREDDPSGDIRSNKEFAAVAQQIPGSAASVSFTDWKTEFESFYQLGTGLLALVPMGEEVPIDMSLLPDSSTLTKHLCASLSYSKNLPNGSETVTTSPWGPEVALGVFALIGAAAAVIPNVVR